MSEKFENTSGSRCVVASKNLANNIHIENCLVIKSTVIVVVMVAIVEVMMTVLVDAEMIIMALMKVR